MFVKGSLALYENNVKIELWVPILEFKYCITKGKMLENKMCNNLCVSGTWGNILKSFL